MFIDRTEYGRKFGGSHHVDGSKGERRCGHGGLPKRENDGLGLSDLVVVTGVVERSTLENEDSKQIAGLVYSMQHALKWLVLCPDMIPVAESTRKVTRRALDRHDRLKEYVGYPIDCDVLMARRVGARRAIAREMGRRERGHSRN